MIITLISLITCLISPGPFQTQKNHWWLVLQDNLTFPPFLTIVPSLGEVDVIWICFGDTEILINSWNIYLYNISIIIVNGSRRTVMSYHNLPCLPICLFELLCCCRLRLLLLCNMLEFRFWAEVAWTAMFRRTQRSRNNHSRSFLFMVSKIVFELITLYNISTTLWCSSESWLTQNNYIPF